MGRWGTAVGALVLSGCLQGGNGMAAGDPAPDCPVISTADWAAWVNLMPGTFPAGPAVVIVTGTVTLAPGAPAVGLQDGPITSGPVPVREVRVVALSSQPIPGAQMRLRHETPAQPLQATGPTRWGELRITCGGREIARLPITEAH